MTISSSDATATRHASAKLYRAAGLGGIGAFLAWLAQPVIVALAGEETSTTLETLRDRPFTGALEAVVFSGIGVGWLFFVVATTRLVRERTHDLSTAARVGSVMGMAGASAWLLVAGLSLGPFTTVGASVSEVAPDSDLQGAMFHVAALVLTGALLTAVAGMAGFIVFLATAGRRAEVIGWPLTIVGILVLAGVAVNLLLPFSPPWALVGSILFVLIVGIAFLVKSRRI